MIAPNELRIGNYFTAGIMTDYETVFTIDYDRIQGYLINKSIPLSHLHPIPLSPSILDKCGFKQDGGSFEKGIYQLSTQKNGKGYKPWVIADEYNHQIGEVILYLHQLQNLYYALTQTELKIQPL